MNICLENIGKRYNREWIFKDINKVFDSPSCCAILGGNGSGKSTLLQIVSGYLTPSAGVVKWTLGDDVFLADSVFKQVAIASPYLNLYDDFTLSENVEFFLNFKSFRNEMNANEFAAKIQLEKQMHKQLKFFSSGMRQRVKLGLAILADAPLLLLDEPTSHLDANAISWFQNLLQDNANARSIFIASNSHEAEIFLCDKKLVVEDFR